MRNSLFILLLILSSFTAETVQAQTKEASLTIEGEVKTKLTLTTSDIAKLPQIPITAKDRNEKEHTYTGAELGLILKNAGVTLGEELKGENLTKYILVEASDGYQVLFSLAEVDPAFTTRRIILASQKDGALLPADEGPFRIIIEGEKRKPRSARQVILIKVKFVD